MNKAFLTVGMIFLGLIAFLLINVISNYSTGSELDYYLVKETAESSMQDAVDMSYYRQTGQIRMDKDEFVESFLRRFADSVDMTRGYRIGFYDLNETPPKVSIKVESSTVLSFDNSKIDMVTTMDGILQTKYKHNQYTTNSNNNQYSAKNCNKIPNTCLEGSE
jgi:hypothetical protein